MATFRIHESNIDRLHKKMTRISNKCAKYGCDFHYEEVGEEFVEYPVDEDTVELRRFIIVEAEGTAKVNGWQFAATIDHTEQGNIVRKMLDTVEIPERYYYCEPTCEHCNSKRHRKDTYIVYNEEKNEFKQVGSSCLCDFTGGFDAEVAAAYIAMFDELIQCEAPGQGWGGCFYYELEELLKYAYYSVKYLGYNSSNCPRWMKSTRETSCNDYLYDNSRHRLFKSEIEEVEKFRDKYHPDYNSDETKSYIAEMLDYFRNTEESSDYMHNLKVLANTRYIKSKETGYVVSMVATYNKYLGKIEERKQREAQHESEKASEYVGKVGDRLTITNPKSVEAITSWTTQYGVTTRFKIIDQNNNVFMWDSSTGIYDKPINFIKGTVKKQEEFRDVKQTWLTRCKIDYVEYKEESAESDNSAEKSIEEFLNYCEA